MKQTGGTMKNESVQLGKLVLSAGDLQETLRHLKNDAPEGMYIVDLRVVPGLEYGDDHGNCEIHLFLLLAYATHTGETFGDKKFQMRLARIGFGGGRLLPAPVSRAFYGNNFPNVTTASAFHALRATVALSNHGCDEKDT